MAQNRMIESLTGTTKERKKSKIPARFDRWQSITGLVLVVFCVFHMLFTSTILLGPEAFDWTVRQAEGAFLFGAASAIPTYLITLFVIGVFGFHGFLAVRKLPSTYKEHLSFWVHRHMLKHTDTSLWIVQCWSGIVLLFLASAHLIVILLSIESISAHTAAARFTSGGFGPFYLILLLAMVTHASIGAYRLVMKWMPIEGRTRQARKVAFVRVKRQVFGVFAALGLLALLGDFAYIKHGNEAQKTAPHLMAKPANH
jgi:fumarate reductase subunit C